VEPNYHNRKSDSPAPTPEREAFEVFSDKIESVVQEYMSVEEIDVVVRAGRVQRSLTAISQQVDGYIKQQVILN
jgi:hypothetical protein